MGAYRLAQAENNIVIGGGLAGCSLAYHLSRRGRRVLLFERRNIASGATGRCGGMVMKIDGRDTDPNEIAKRWRYVAENDRMLDAFERELEADFGLWRRGSLDIALEDDEADVLRDIVRLQQDILGDAEIQWLEGRDLTRLSPVLSDKVVGARYRPSDGCLDPFKLSHSLLRRAVRQGTEVHARTTVEEILIENGSVVGVRADGRTYPADTVINATNGWAARLTPELPIVPLRSLAVITEPAPPVPALTFEAELHAKIVYGCTQTKRGNLLIGGPPEKAASITGQFDETVSLGELRVNTAVLTELFPPLADLHVIRAWAGAMGITPDGMPCVGPVPGYEGLYCCAGFPNGMSYVPICARLLAEHLVDGESSLPLTPLDPGRFAGRHFDWPETYDYTILAEVLGRTGDERQADPAPAPDPPPAERGREADGPGSFPFGNAKGVSTHEYE